MLLVGWSAASEYLVGWLSGRLAVPWLPYLVGWLGGWLTVPWPTQISNPLGNKRNDKRLCVDKGVQLKHETVE